MNGLFTKIRRQIPAIIPQEYYRGDFPCLFAKRSLIFSFAPIFCGRIFFYNFYTLLIEFINLKLLALTILTAVCGRE